MKQEIRHSVLVAALLGIALAGCQKKEEVPTPELGSEAPAPEAMPPEPAMAEPAPGVEPAPTGVPMEPVPGEAGEAAPTQPTQ